MGSSGASEDLAERLMAAVDVAAARKSGAAGAVRRAMFDCTRTTGGIAVGCDEIEVEYRDGETDGLYDVSGVTTDCDSELLDLVPTAGEDELAVRIGRGDDGAAWIVTDVRDAGL